MRRRLVLAGAHGFAAPARAQQPRLGVLTQGDAGRAIRAALSPDRLGRPNGFRGDLRVRILRRAFG